MKQANLAEAKAHLSELVARAAAGEPVCIMRRGKTSGTAYRCRWPAQMHRHFRDASNDRQMPAQPERARNLILRRPGGENSRGAPRSLRDPDG
jgi:antitoxin (DNA-binding transcriptional repressor) of toxin-antitoxin stability system